MEDGKIAFHGKTNLLDTIQDVVNYEPHIILAATDNVPDFLKGLKKVHVFHGYNSKKRSGKHIEAHFNIRGLFDLFGT